MLHFDKLVISKETTNSISDLNTADLEKKAVLFSPKTSGLTYSRLVGPFNEISRIHLDTNRWIVCFKKKKKDHVTVVIYDVLKILDTNMGP